MTFSVDIPPALLIYFSLGNPTAFESVISRTYAHKEAKRAPTLVTEHRAPWLHPQPFVAARRPQCLRGDWRCCPWTAGRRAYSQPWMRCWPPLSPARCLPSSDLPLWLEPFWKPAGSYPSVRCHQGRPNPRQPESALCFGRAQGQSACSPPAVPLRSQGRVSSPVDSYPF